MPSVARRGVGRPQRPAPRRRRPPSRPPSTSCNVVFWTLGSHLGPARILARAHCPPEDLGLPLAGGRPQRPPASIRKSNGAASERVGAGVGGGRQRASGYGRRLAALPAWGDCSTIRMGRPKPQARQCLGASARARLPPFSHDNRATPPSRQRSLTGAPARSALPPTSTPLPPSPKSCPFAFPNAHQWALWAPIGERQAEIFGRAVSAGQNASRTPVADSGTDHPNARPPSAAVNPAVSSYPQRLIRSFIRSCTY